MGALTSLDRRALYVGLACTGALAVAIVMGSRGLEDYDPVLLPYTFGVLFACFAVVYRYAVWLRRPPTRLYWDRGWQLLLRKGELWRNAAFAGRSVYENLLEQRFVRRP
jgi:hypothetical protein